VAIARWEDEIVRFRGKIAIVTASGGGIGLATARAFAAEGANVVICDIMPELVDSAVTEIRRMGANAIGTLCDVTDPAQTDALADECRKAFGAPDILVNNAGTAGGDIGNRFLEGMDRQVWQSMLNINLIGTFNATMSVIHDMIGKKGGRIVNTASLAGRQPDRQVGPYYAAAKAGVIGFTRHMALVMAPHGINVNAIAPGIIVSGERREKMWRELPEEKRQEILSGIPLGRLGKLEDITNLTTFLSSDQSSYITGATIDINGGMFMAV
jgi:NAD(P)-dependent dehydrogenase (short-subunit alcohol dehydrogenase family)